MRGGDFSHSEIDCPSRPVRRDADRPAFAIGAGESNRNTAGRPNRARPHRFRLVGRMTWNGRGFRKTIAFRLISPPVCHGLLARSEEHTSELQSLMRTSYAVFCLKKKNTTTQHL